jgi:hypothetical protein
VLRSLIRMLAALASTLRRGRRARAPDEDDDRENVYPLW